MFYFLIVTINILQRFQSNFLPFFLTIINKPLIGETDNTCTSRARNNFGFRFGIRNRLLQLNEVLLYHSFTLRHFLSIKRSSNHNTFVKSFLITHIFNFFQQCTIVLILHSFFFTQFHCRAASKFRYFNYFHWLYILQQCQVNFIGFNYIIVVILNIFQRNIIIWCIGRNTCNYSSTFLHIYCCQWIDWYLLIWCQWCTDYAINKLLSRYSTDFINFSQWQTIIKGLE